MFAINLEDLYAILIKKQNELLLPKGTRIKVWNNLVNCLQIGFLDREIVAYAVQQEIERIKEYEISKMIDILGKTRDRFQTKMIMHQLIKMTIGESNAGI